VVLTPGLERYWEEAAQLLEASDGNLGPPPSCGRCKKHNMDAGGQVRRFSSDN